MVLILLEPRCFAGEGRGRGPGVGARGRGRGQGGGVRAPTGLEGWRRRRPRASSAQRLVR